MGLMVVSWSPGYLLIISWWSPCRRLVVSSPGGLGRSDGRGYTCGPYGPGRHVRRGALAVFGDLC